MERRPLFLRKTLKVRTCYPECLEPISNFMKDLPDVKTSESSQRFDRNSKFMIGMNYLPCPREFLFKIAFGIQLLFII